MEKTACTTTYKMWIIFFSTFFLHIPNWPLKWKLKITNTTTNPHYYPITNTCIINIASDCKINEKPPKKNPLKKKRKTKQKKTHQISKQKYPKTLQIQTQEPHQTKNTNNPKTKKKLQRRERERERVPYQWDGGRTLQEWIQSSSLWGAVAPAGRVFRPSYTWRSGLDAPTPAIEKRWTAASPRCSSPPILF